MLIKVDNEKWACIRARETYVTKGAITGELINEILRHLFIYFWYVIAHHDSITPKLDPSLNDAKAKINFD